MHSGYAVQSEGRKNGKLFMAGLCLVVGGCGSNGQRVRKNRSARTGAHTATAVRAVIMAAVLVAVAVFQRRWEHLPELWADKRAMTFILLSGVAGALSWLFYFTALKYGKVSQVAPVDKLSVVLAATAAVVFLHETVSVMSAAGIGLITAGIILVALG